LLFRPTNGSFISRRTHLWHLAPYFRSGLFDRHHRYHPLSWPGGEYREFSNTPYVYTHARMYTYRWLIESKGRGRYKVCRPPRHETHALPLERRRRRTSSCSNVHLVSVDTPTLSAIHVQRTLARRGRRRCAHASAKEYRATKGVLYCTSWMGYEGIIVWCVPSEFFSPSSFFIAPLTFSFGSSWFFIWFLILSLVSFAVVCDSSLVILRSISLKGDRY